MKKKGLALFLALLMLSGSLASCAEDTSTAETKPNTSETAGTADTSAGNTEETVPEPVDPIVKRDFEGYTFRFLNGNTSYDHNSLVVEEESAEIIDNSFYRRNMITGERFNIEFSETISNSPQADYSASILADDYSFDVATLRMEWAFPVVVENQALNWAEIPNIDLTQDYWVQNSLKAFSLMNNIYFAVSAFDITHYDSVRAFGFNKNLVEQYQLESPYDLVNNGTWTLSKYQEQCMIVANDENGDGKWTAEDKFGTDGWSNVYINTLMAGIGSILSIGKDENDMPYFDLDQEEHMNRIQTICDMMKERNNGLVYNGNGDIFRNGHALFYNGLICAFAPFREMEDDFGIIPAPKYDEAQEGYLNLGGSPFFMVVPIVSDDLDRTGAIMEGLAYDSVGIIDEAYYEKLLKGKMSRDEESTEMLDLIFSTLEYYHPLANSYLNAPMADDLIWNSSTRIASYFKAVRKQIDGEINEALTTYKTNMGIDVTE